MKRTNGSIFLGKQAGSAPRKTGSKEGVAGGFIVRVGAPMVVLEKTGNGATTFAPRNFRIGGDASERNVENFTARPDAALVQTKPSIPILAPPPFPPPLQKSAEQPSLRTRTIISSFEMARSISPQS